MPLRFWKKEKPEKGKEQAAEAAKETPPKAAPPETKVLKPEPEVQKAELKPGPPAAPAGPADLESIVNGAHAGLVELGLTVAPTKAAFAKRVAAYPGGEPAFLADYGSKRYQAVTRVLVDWLGFRVPGTFEPASVLREVNLRLSSFKLNVEAKDLTWLDQELNLRKTKLILGNQERIVRFKDARDLVRGVNEMLAPRKLAFVELETWSDDCAFLLVREPRWDKLANPDLVVVKAEQTAQGGECGECGAPVGKYWRDCLKCGAVFG